MIWWRSLIYKRFVMDFSCAMYTFWFLGVGIAKCPVNLIHPSSFCRPLTSPYIYGEIRILITFSAESPYLAIIRILYKLPFNQSESSTYVVFLDGPSHPRLGRNNCQTPTRGIATAWSNSRYPSGKHYYQYGHPSAEHWKRAMPHAQTPHSGINMGKMADDKNKNTMEKLR